VKLPLAGVLAALLIGCGSAQDPDSDEHAVQACSAPESPYADGSEQEAGYFWAKTNGDACELDSSTANAGCMEYRWQQTEYEKCSASN